MAARSKDPSPAVKTAQGSDGLAGNLRFSANLGFLWADLPLPDAIRAAHHAGFDAVVHVMAGIAAGDDARRTFLENLRYACAQAAPCGIRILIEPLNRHDAPGYFLRTTTQAIDIIEAFADDRLKLMFDCYHVQRTEGDLTHRLQALRLYIGHIQFAGVPDRGPPIAARSITPMSSKRSEPWAGPRRLARNTGRMATRKTVWPG